MDAFAVRPTPPPQATTRLKWFFRSSPASATHGFNVLSEFDQLQHSKGIKSNSWFHAERTTKSSSVRRIASAPNANNRMITKQASPPMPPIPQYDDKWRQQSYDKSTMMMASTPTLISSSSSHSDHQRLWRRSYAANSVKVRQVQVGPSSFTKIRLLGRGDVGKVYLVKQKGTDKLLAMKGKMNERRLTLIVINQ